MIPFRDAPIKRKLVLVILMTTSLALVLMAGAVVGYELLTFRAAITTNTGVLAQVVGSISTSSLAFDNKEDAAEVLNVLSAERQITAAAIYDAAGNIFARFPKNAPDALIPEKPGEMGSSMHATHLVIFQPITQTDEHQLGTIYLRADLREMYSRLMVYGGLVIVAGLTAIAGSFAVSTVLQRRITLPIVELAEIARAVSKRQDYSVRARGHGQDEIGDLTSAFNEMLTRIGQARAALAGSEERLRLALEGSETGTWDWDLTTGQISWDDYMFPLYSITKEQWDGNEDTFIRLIHPDDQQDVKRCLKEAVDSQRNLDVRFRLTGKDGRARHMAIRGRVFNDAEGRPARMSGVSMDVTAAKQSEEALQQAKETAEAANRAKDEFLAILSHELRTPLTPVLTTLAMLEDEPATPAPVLRELEMIRRNVEVEARLIDDLLDVTRIARGKLELHVQTVDFRTLLNHAVTNYLDKQAVQKKLRVSVKIEPEVNTHIHADSSRITQVLWNLLQNACKFTPEGGTISIVAENAPMRPGESGTPDLTISITDSGIGIDAEILPKIFDAFEQGERSRTRVFGGLGLGLAVSKAIVGMHSGSLTAASRGKDMGATFTLRLPTVAASRQAGSSIAIPSMAVGDPPTARQAAPPVPASARILLVEDHDDTAKQLARLLARAGYAVTCACTLATARSAAAGADLPFDLLVSDLGLPDGSGHDLMREFSRLYKIPGIVLSGYGMEADVRESLAAGFSKHLTKPVNWSELKAAIHALLNQEKA